MNYFDQIYAYKEGQLTAEDKLLFEQELVTNVALRNAMKDYKDTERLAEGLLEVDMLETIERLQKETSGQSDQSSPKQITYSTGGLSRIWLYLLLGLIIAIFIAFVFYSNRTKKINPEQFFAEYYQPPIMDDLTRGESPENIDLFNAQNLFLQKKYIESELLLQELIENGENISIANFYLGHIHLNRQEYKKAAQAFSQSQEPQAVYNLALTYVLMKERDKAKELLSKMSTWERERLEEVL